MKKDGREEVKKEILSLPPNLHGRLLLAPRLGKTSIVISLIKRDKPKKILWVTPLAELAEKVIPQEFITWKALKYLKNLQTVTWASLHTIEGEYDTIILDEEQHITENNIVNFLNGKITYRNIISMTGTPSKDNYKRQLYNLLKLPILYCVDINLASDLDILSDYEINVLQFPLSTKKDIVVKTKHSSFYTSEKAQYDYYSTKLDTQFGGLWRRRGLASTNTKKRVVQNLLKQISGRVLIFAPYIEIAEEISDKVYHGKSNNKKHFTDFIEKKSNELCLVNKGGTGVTYEDINHLIVVQADSDKNGLTTQKIMRCLLKDGTKPTIWILCHENTQDEVWVDSTLENFKQEKIKFIKTYGN